MSGFEIALLTFAIVFGFCQAFCVKSDKKRSDEVTKMHKEAKDRYGF